MRKASWEENYELAGAIMYFKFRKFSFSGVDFEK
jgi:hypothetical protein